MNYQNKKMLPPKESLREKESLWENYPVLVWRDQNGTGWLSFYTTNSIMKETINETD